MALHIVLALSLIETLVLAGVLWHWAKAVPGARLLTVFLLGVATWIVSNELPNWFGPATMPWALRLGATIPMTSAAFLHFSVRFCGLEERLRPGVFVAYGVALATMLLTWIVPPGEFIHFPAFTGVEWVLVPHLAGWIASMVWALLAAAGVAVLLYRLWRTDDARERRQLAAVAVSCGWGLVCASGYGFAALGIPWYPWQVLAMPAYPVILVYGILRYQVFVANAWARRALAWTLLVGLGLLSVPLTLLLPLDSRWLSGAAVAVVCLALNGPVRRIAERIVYPGGTASATDLQAWRDALAAAPSWEALESSATELLSKRVGLRVDVRVNRTDDVTEDGSPMLICRASGTGWATSLRGWDSAPPGPRHLAELFAGVLTEACGRLQQAALAEQRERERQLQARLAELGALAASVAHDLRNPLNIIAMAVATTPPDVRREVAGQVGRISHLAEDLLDYAKPWQVRPVAVDAALQVREAARHTPEVEIGRGLDETLTLHADPMRFAQAIGNLLSNARAAPGVRRVLVDAERDGAQVHLHVCDDGAGVPADLRERLFEPFASRSPAGTGLGLAIVARIMAAHGGSVRLAERPPWNTCFTLTFPAAS
ncbi:sensor histidine kinase [Variovorax sp. Sphag1AA]|uniref:sensor histidine kinase n=1 Tax=Variovorax sp. Sphag1AA TaxID=2587027 RepID=UPI00161D220C|nr:sensor histidine kinase [Variovorax sp. Sphag1AA]MBB3178029.1 signal transduction histidine kinase [Variovorax sp. Sphag1AA]